MSGGHGGAVVKHSPSISEVCGSNPRVGKVGSWQFTVQNLDQQYVLVSSGHKTTHHDMTCTVLNSDIKTQIHKWSIFIYLGFYVAFNNVQVKS